MFQENGERKEENRQERADMLGRREAREQQHYVGCFDRRGHVARKGFLDSIEDQNRQDYR